MTKKDYIVYIGRFQPPHLAHIKIIKEALKLAEQIIIVVGSADQPRTFKNPWTWQEREQMIRASLSDDVQERVIVIPAHDKISDEQWAEEVQVAVDSVAIPESTIAVIGHSKDETSYYLQMFPQWGEPIDVGNIEDIHASDVREALWNADDEDDFELKVGRNLPRGIHDYLRAFMLSEEYEQLRREYFFNKRYKRAWDWDATLDAFLEERLPHYSPEDQVVIVDAIDTLRNNFKVAPYDVQFNTVDAIVVQSGHILLVRRKSEPGKGLYAMPGGFCDSHERLEDAVIRELREETKLKLPEPVLRGNITKRTVIDDPIRSLRGRTFTYVFVIQLPPGPLPRVKGGDDADKAKWVPLSVFRKMEPQMFEDHYRVINSLV